MRQNARSMAEGQGCAGQTGDFRRRSARGDDKSVKGDGVVDVTDAVKDIPHIGPHDLINGLIERFSEYRPKLEAAVASGSDRRRIGVDAARDPTERPHVREKVAAAAADIEQASRSVPVSRGVHTVDVCS